MNFYLSKRLLKHFSRKIDRVDPNYFIELKASTLAYFVFMDKKRQVRYLI